MEREIEPFYGTVFGNGRIVIPKTLRDMHKIIAGTKLRIIVAKVEG